MAGCGAGEGIRDEGGQAVVSPIANAGVAHYGPLRDMPVDAEEHWGGETQEVAEALKS